MSFVETSASVCADQFGASLLPQLDANRPLSDGERFRFAFDRASVGIFQSSPSGHFSRCNRALARMFNFESPEALLRSIDDIGHDLYVVPGQFEEMSRLINANGAVMNFEVQVYRRGGEKIWVSVNAWALRNSNGSTLFIEGFVEEITARKWQRHSQRTALGNSNSPAAGMGHAGLPQNLESPLDEVIGILDRLGATPLSPQQHRYVREARALADTVLHLVAPLHETL